MQWTYNNETECFTDETHTEYRGAYGYTIIPYVEQWSIYFVNGWRHDGPPGEYLTKQGENSCVYAIPSLGLTEELLFDSLEEAQQAAQVHQDSKVDPEGGMYMLTCVSCNVRSPNTYDEDQVIDAAIDAGWKVEGNNEDDQDLCPSCQPQANLSYTLNGIILSTGEII